MAEAATKQPGDSPGLEQVKIPVRDGDAWRCPDCNGQLVGDVEREGVRCDRCNISWSVGFMEELLEREQKAIRYASGLPNRPLVAPQGGTHIFITDGKQYVILSTARALLFASKIQRMAAKGLVWLEE